MLINAHSAVDIRSTFERSVFDVGVYEGRIMTLISVQGSGSSLCDCRVQGWAEIMELETECEWGIASSFAVSGLGLIHMIWWDLKTDIMKLSLKCMTRRANNQ